MALAAAIERKCSASVPQQPPTIVKPYDFFSALTLDAKSAGSPRSSEQAVSEQEPPSVDALAREQPAAAGPSTARRATAWTASHRPRRSHRLARGASMAVFFGGDKMRAAWRESLAREQIWAPVYHAESF